MHDRCAGHESGLSLHDEATTARRKSPTVKVNADAAALEIKAGKKSPPRRAGSFRQRFDDLDRRREQLIARLESLGDKATVHPGHKRALTLLNATFRKASLAQRVAVLQAASWLIDLLENVTFFV